MLENWVSLEYLTKKSLFLPFNNSKSQKIYNKSEIKSRKSNGKQTKWGNGTRENFKNIQIDEKLNKNSKISKQITRKEYNDGLSDKLSGSTNIFFTYNLISKSINLDFPTPLFEGITTEEKQMKIKLLGKIFSVLNSESSFLVYFSYLDLLKNIFQTIYSNFRLRQSINILERDFNTFFAVVFCDWNGKIVWSRNGYGMKGLFLGFQLSVDENLNFFRFLSHYSKNLNFR